MIIGDPDIAKAYQKRKAFTGEGPKRVRRLEGRAK